MTMRSISTPVAVVSLLLLVLSVVVGTVSANDPLDDILSNQTTIITETIEEVLILEDGKNASDADGITEAAIKVMDAYNEENKDDPHKKRIIDVDIIRIDEVTINTRRNLRSRRAPRGSGRELRHSSRNAVRAVMRATGVCTNCDPNAQLTDDTHNRHRRLGKSSKAVSIKDIIKRQNKMIKDSDNDTVEEVDDLLFEAVILAAKANVAAENAEVHEAYVDSLEKEIKKKRKRLKESEVEAQQQMNSAYYGGSSYRSLLHLHNTLSDLLYRLDDELLELERLHQEAKNEQDRLQQEAESLKAQASAAEQAYIEAQQQMAIGAKEEAKHLNSDKAVEVTSIKYDARLIHATFDDSLNGFTYHDDMFHGTSQSWYAEGSHSTSGDGALQVELGGKDSYIVHGMSGGWERTFTLDRPATNVEIAFNYKLTISQYFESDEVADILAMLNGVHYDVDSVHGTYEQTSEPTTGAKKFAKNIGSLPAGTHTVKIGAYLNKKTWADEIATAIFSNFILTVDYSTGTVPPPTSTGIAVPEPSVVLDDNFNGQSSDGFNLKLDAFGYYTDPKYIKENPAKNGNIRLTIGGVDDSRVSNMSAGWFKTFNVGVAGRYKLSLRYKTNLLEYVDHGEDAHSIVKVDNSQYVMSTLYGDSNKESQSTGWKKYYLDLGHLDSGDHEIAVGGTLTGKSYYVERMVLWLDWVKIEPE